MMYSVSVGTAVDIAKNLTFTIQIPQKGKKTNCIWLR
jgi:hypothetical protein